MIHIKSGTVYTITNGILKDTDIIVKDSKIKEIGKNLKAESGAKIIDAKGKFVFPGFIDAHSHIGLFEEGIGFEGTDVNEMTDPITPHVRGIDGINPRDEAFGLALNAGVTTVSAGPGSANVVGGTFVVMKLVGDRVDDMVIDPNYAMKCAFGENPKRVYNAQKKTPMTRMGSVALLRQLILETIDYNNRKKAAAGDATKMPAYNMKYEAMIDVVEGRIGLKAHAHRADDIFASIRIAQEFDLKLTLDHCTEGHLIVSHLAKAGYAAIVGPSLMNKSKFELNEKTFETAGVLDNAGVKVAIMTDSPVIPLEYLVTCAALAHKAGMKEDSAIRAITINAAEILRQDHRIGSLEVGKDADIAIWDRHPFDLQARTNFVMVDGNIVVEN